MSLLDQKKKPGSLDDVIDLKFNQLASLVDSRLQDVYKDFNLAMGQKNQEDKRLEITLTNMVNLMWGLLNEQKIRLITLENYLVDSNAVDPEKFQEDYLENISKFKETSGWEEIPLQDAFQQNRVNPLDTVGNLTPNAQDFSGNPEKPF
jgi:hypothetical protein